MNARVEDAVRTELDDRDLVGQPVGQLQTPALLVDLRAMEKNLQTMAHYFRTRPAKLRPHFKNHRVLDLAHQQIQNGAIGITCARLWHAERLVAAGIKNVLIANELAGEAQLRRFVEISREASVIVAVDNVAVVTDLARLARNGHGRANVVVDIDLGLKRCGVTSIEAAVLLARAVVEQGLHLSGIMGYEGHLQTLPDGAEKCRLVAEAMHRLLNAKQAIESAAIPVKMVSCGGTGDYSITGSFPGVTENQAGSYLLMDTGYTPFAPDFQPATSVLATIISKTVGERVVADAGVKALSGERGIPSVKNCSGLKLRALHAEHAPIDIVEPGVQIEVGDKIEIAVRYHDGTIHLHRRMYGIRDGRVERIFAVEHGV